MEDVAPQLLEEIQKTFNQKVKKNKRITSFLSKVKEGTVNFNDMQLYSKELGQVLGDTFIEVLKEDVLPDGTLYWNIAERTMLPMLNNNFELVTNASIEVLKIIDIKDGIGLKAITPQRPNERIKGILDNVTVGGIPFEETQRRMKEPVTNLTESFFDDFIKQNADFRYKAGLYPQIIRIVKGSKACKWCKSLAGIYEYGEVMNTGNDVFRRHENCHCQVIMRTNKIRQDVHTKKIV